ncbi:branched-chain amino acid ABC transporter permease [Pelagibacterium nitratireducens]|uniref:Branched-chain amino acid ABC transporter permease n=2 Tax=Pelagibacterium nitratireducens TaxID=1046114 RepID=A0ABZ2I4F2_9HYPH
MSSQQNTTTSTKDVHAKDALSAAKGRYRVAVDTKASRIGMVIMGLVVLILFAAPGFVERALLQDLILILMLIGLAQCWNLLAGYAGLISVGQQAFVGVGAYGMFYVVIMMGADPLLSVLISAVFVALLSIPVGLVVFRLQGAYFAVVTWVVAEVFRLIAAIWPALGGGTGTALPRSATSEMIGLDFAAELFGVRSAAAREIVIYWGALAVVAMIVIVAYFMLRSRLGLALSAIKDGEIAAESVGIDINGTKFLVYVFAAFGAGLIGALYFLQQARVSPDAAFSVIDWTAYVIFIVVIGGLGTIEGPIIGAIVFVLLRSWFSSFGPWYLMFLGLLAIVMMLFAPKGLWGMFSSATNIRLFPTRKRLERDDRE